VVASEPRHASYKKLAGEYLRFYRDTILNRHYNDHPGLLDGSAWPPGSQALSMAGQRRLDHIVALIATVVSERVPGHFIETGVWRGGMSFLAAKTLDVLGTKARRVYLCDSFSGIPDQTAYGKNRKHAAQAGHEQDGRAHKLEILNDNSETRVRRDAALFEISPERVRFVPGYFNESLPALMAREPDATFAVIRLDGDTYWSTYEALETLYPHLSPGGFVVIDDYTDWAGCRVAVDTYRTYHKISSPIALVPYEKGEFVRGAYFRKPFIGSGGDTAGTAGVAAGKSKGHGATSVADPNAGDGLCVGSPANSLRIPGSLNPGRRVPTGPPAAKEWGISSFLGDYHPPTQLYRCES